MHDPETKHRAKLMTARKLFLALDDKEKMF
jgi:hypothetical protein